MSSVSIFVMLRLLGKIGPRIRGAFVNHPTISTLSLYTIGFATTTLTVHQYIKAQTKSLEVAVYKNIEVGTQPPLLHDGQMISRDVTAEEIVDLFFPCSDKGEDQGVVGNGSKRSFGLIVGPTGTGKTALVTNLCNMLPELFYEVREPEAFSTDLATALAMKIAPSSVFDLFLSYISSDYFMYYKLADNQKVALDTIFKVLEKAANQYKMVHGKTPTLFIDSADLLAKHEKGLFVHLVSHAKCVANGGILQLDMRWRIIRRF